MVGIKVLALLTNPCQLTLNPDPGIKPLMQAEVRKPLQLKLELAWTFKPPLCLGISAWQEQCLCWANRLPPCILKVPQEGIQMKSAVIFEFLKSLRVYSCVSDKWRLYFFSQPFSTFHLCCVYSRKQKLFWRLQWRLSLPAVLQDICAQYWDMPRLLGTAWNFISHVIWVVLVHLQEDAPSACVYAFLCTSVLLCVCC